MGKKDLKTHVQSKQRAPGWHGGGVYNRMTNAERAKLGLAPLPSLEKPKGRTSPNLVKNIDGTLTNTNEVTFTLAEKRALENEVNKANRKRMKMLEAEAKLPRVVGGKQTGGEVRDLQSMGKESDFILAPKSKSLHQFKSKEDYNRYMKNLQRVNSVDYLDERVRAYKRNHMTALENAFGDDAKDVVMKIRMMKPKDYMKLIQSDEDLEINYIYDPSEKSGKLNQIRAALGMNLKEDVIPEA